MDFKAKPSGIHLFLVELVWLKCTIEKIQVQDDAGHQ